MRSIKALVYSLVLLSFVFSASGCLGPVYVLYEAVKPEENTPDKAALNDAPVVSVGTIGRQYDSSSITVDFTLADPDGGTGSVDVYFRIGAGSWNACTGITGATTGLTSPAGGSSHSITWDAVTDLGGAGTVNDVTVSIIPSDSYESGVRDESNTFTAGNDAPVLTLGTISSPQLGNIIINYEIQDDSADPVNLTCEYSITSGSTGFSSFTVAAGETFGVTTSETAPGEAHSIVWASHDYIINVNRPTVWIRITATDPGGGADIEVAGSFEVLNNGARPVCSLAPILRAADPQIQIDYSLIDNDSDTGSVSIQYSPDNSNWTNCTEEDPVTVSEGKTGLTMSPSPGDAHVFVWDSETDLGTGLHTDYYLRIVPNDGNWVGIGGKTGPFDIGNDDPTVSVTTPSGTQSGNVVISYAVSDTSSDFCTVRIYRGLSDTGPWNLASAPVSANPETLVSSSPLPGTDHTFVWGSASDYPDTADVYIRVEADDLAGGTPGDEIIGPISVDNTTPNSPPVAVMGAVSRQFNAAAIPVTFNLSDADAATTCDIEIYFQDEGKTWTLCNESDFNGGVGTPLTGLTAPQGGQDHTVTWNGTGVGMLTNGSNTTTLVQFRVIANDGTADSLPGDSEAFSAGNDSPTVTVIDPAADQTGNVVIDYNLSDPASDSCSLEIRWRLDSGSWPGNLCTSAAVSPNPEPGITSLPSGSGGVDHSFVWDTATDLGTVTESVWVRVTATDGGTAQGVDTVSAPFTVNNNQEPSVTFLFSEMVLSDDYTVIPAPFRIQDPEGDVCSIELEYKLFGDTLWSPCTEFPETLSEGTSNLTSYILSGDEEDGDHLFLWNSLADCGRVDQQCELRIRATDSNSNVSGYVLKLVVLKNVEKWQKNTPLTINTGSNSIALATGDLNGDGSLDIAVANWGSYDYTVIYGDAVGFEDPVAFDGKKNPLCVAMGDINGDGYDDLVGGNYLGASLSICYGGPTGHKAPVLLENATIGTVQWPDTIIIVDINKDGYEDIVANNRSRQLYLSMGSAAGHETTARRYTASTNSSSQTHMAVGDINGDGYPDIAHAASGDDAIGIFYGSGTDPFLAPAVFLTVEDNPQWVTIADINGDGFGDIINSNRSQPSVTYAYGPDPIASGAVSIAGGTTAECIASGDINGDGYADFAWCDKPTYVYFGSAGGPVLAGTITAPAGGDYCLIEDVNGDGYDDLMWAEMNYQEINLHFGHRYGIEITPQVLPAGEWVSNIKAVDINCDGYKDIITANYDSNDVTIYTGGPRIGTSPQTFTTGTQPTVVVAGDVNSDGLDDMLCVNWLNGNLYTYYGSLSAYDGPYIYALNSVGEDVDTGDVNGDGYTDVICTNRSGDDLFVGYGSPAGHLELESFDTGFWIEDIAICDYNQDGFDDVTVLHFYDDGVSISMGSASGLTTPVYSSVGTPTQYPTAVTIGNMDGDPYPDVAVVNQYGNNVCFIYGSAVGYDPSPFQAETISTQPHTIGAGDIDGDGYTDIWAGNLYNTTMTLWYGDSTRTAFTTDTETAGEGSKFMFGEDVNNDGYSEMISLNLDSNDLILYYGSAAGPINPVSLPAGTGPRHGTSGDINNDGYPDLIWTAMSSDEIRFALGSANGISTMERIPTGVSPQFVSTGDVNGDGFQDILCTVEGEDVFTLYHGSLSSGMGQGEFKTLDTSSTSDSISVHRTGIVFPMGAFSGSTQNTTLWTGSENLEPQPGAGEYLIPVSYVWKLLPYNTAIQGGAEGVMTIQLVNLPSLTINWGSFRLYRWDWGTDRQKSYDDNIIQVAATSDATLTVNIGEETITTAGGGNLSQFGKYQVFLVLEDSDTTPDGMPDAFERHYFGDLSRDGTGDWDTDGLSDIDEYRYGSNPLLTDSDGDGYSDFIEVNIGYNPTGTNDSLIDSDKDSLPDEWEMAYFGDIATQTGYEDTDADTVLNITEYRIGTDPSDNTFNDADLPAADGLMDEWEVYYFGSIVSADAAGDPDSDGVSNLNEMLNGTDPTDTSGDTDKDGISDAVEIGTAGLNPLNNDSDGDGYRDGWENTNGYDPTDSGDHP